MTAASLSSHTGARTADCPEVSPEANSAVCRPTPVTSLETVRQAHKGRCDLGSLSRNGKGRHFREVYDFATPRQVCNASVREPYVQGPPNYARQGACDHEKFKSLGPFKETSA